MIAGGSQFFCFTRNLSHLLRVLETSSNVAEDPSESRTTTMLRERLDDLEQSGILYTYIGQLGLSKTPSGTMIMARTQ
jgi:hypothetical protein